MGKFLLTDKMLIKDTDIIVVKSGKMYFTVHKSIILMNHFTFTPIEPLVGMQFTRCINGKSESGELTEDIKKAIKNFNSLGEFWIFDSFISYLSWCVITFPLVSINNL